jgi:hypothetical protein
MAIRDARVVIDALADPQTLYVFGVIAARTSKVGRRAALDPARLGPGWRVALDS